MHVHWLCVAVIALVLAVSSASGQGRWQDTETRTVKLGPIEVPANEKKMQMIDFPKPIEGEDFAWVSMDMRLVDEADKDVKPDSIYMHHIVIGSFQKQSVMCSVVEVLSENFRDETGQRDSVGRIGAVGSDFTGTHFSFPFAYHAPRNESWKGGFHLLSNEPVAKKVWFAFTFSVLRYPDGKRPEALRPVEVVWLDVQQDCMAGFPVPGSNATEDFAAKLFVKSRTWKSPFAGVIALALGHVHRGGVEIILSHENNVICPAKATYNPEDNGYISAMGTCGGIDENIKIGDILEVVAVYNNTEPIKGAMGIFMAYAYITDFKLHRMSL